MSYFLLLEAYFQLSIVLPLWSHLAENLDPLSVFFHQIQKTIIKSLSGFRSILLPREYSEGCALMLRKFVFSLSSKNETHSHHGVFIVCATPKFQT